MHEEWKLDSCSQLLAVYAISNNSNMPKQHSRCPRRVVFPQGDSQAASAAKCIKLCSKFRNGACRKDGAELLERYASFQMIFPDCCRVHFPFTAWPSACPSVAISCHDTHWSSPNPMALWYVVLVRSDLFPGQLLGRQGCQRHWPGR